MIQWTLACIWSTAPGLGKPSFLPQPQGCTRPTPASLTKLLVSQPSHLWMHPTWHGPNSLPLLPETHQPPWSCQTLLHLLKSPADPLAHHSPACPKPHPELLIPCFSHSFQHWWGPVHGSPGLQLQGLKQAAWS